MERPIQMPEFTLRSLRALRETVTLLLFILAALSAEAFALPSFQEVKSLHRVSDAVILDRHGEVIHELRIDKSGRRLDWTGLKDISPSLVKGVLQSEDRRFYGHGGVDWRAVGAAAINRLFGSGGRGASTISMQLAVMLEPGGAPRGRKTLRRKWDQIAAARELEGGWKKEEILEAYLNLVSFRGELQGIAAASRGIFAKEPAGLNDRESVVLAALIRAPNALLPRWGAALQASPAPLRRKAAMPGCASSPWIASPAPIA
jgi:penicillin-binding protein 1C